MTPRAKILGSLLAVSVAINLIIAGIVVGGHFRRPPAPRIGDMAMGYTMRAPHALRPVIERKLADAAPQLKADVNALRDARRAFAASLRAEPFNRDATAAAMAALRAAADRQREHLHILLLDVYANATPDERREAAGTWFRRMGGDRDDRGGPPPPPPPPPPPQ